MTRKDYQIVATMVGDMGRGVPLKTFNDQVAVAVRHMKGTGNFDPHKFEEWAHEVREGIRDLDGRKR